MVNNEYIVRPMTRIIINARESKFCVITDRPFKFKNRSWPLMLIILADDPLVNFLRKDQPALQFHDLRGRHKILDYEIKPFVLEYELPVLVHELLLFPGPILENIVGLLLGLLDSAHQLIKFFGFDVDFLLERVVLLFELDVVFGHSLLLFFQPLLFPLAILNLLFCFEGHLFVLTGFGLELVSSQKELLFRFELGLQFLKLLFGSAILLLFLLESA